MHHHPINLCIVLTPVRKQNPSRNETRLQRMWRFFFERFFPIFTHNYELYFTLVSIMIVTYMVICALIGFLFSYKWKRRRLIEMVNKFDGPPTVPILGNALFCFCSPRDFLNKALKIVSQYKSPFRVWLFHKPFVVISDPDDFQTISFKALDKSSNYDTFAEFFGDGIFTCAVDRWKRFRRVHNPVFSVKVMLRCYLKIFNQQNDVIQYLKKQAGTGKHFDLWPLMIGNSIKLLCKTALDYDGISEKEVRALAHNLKKGAELTCERVFKPWLRIPIISNIHKYLKGYENLHDEAQALLMKIYEKKKKDVREQKINNNDIFVEDGKTFQNLIDSLFLFAEANDDITDQNLAEEVSSVMFGGSETNAVCASFTLLMLGIRQDLQDKVYNELFEIFGDSDRMPEMEDLFKLNYLEQCLKETLRRFTIVPFIIRFAKEDIPISNGKVIPRGADIILGIIGVHFNPNIYPQPMIWNPDNFSADKVSKRHLCSFTAFSAGPRNCVGQKYAMLVMKAMLSTILRNFKVSTDVKMEDIDLDFDLIIRSKNGYNVKVDYRHGKSLF